MDQAHGWNNNRPAATEAGIGNNDIRDQRGFTSSGSCRLTLFDIIIILQGFDVQVTLEA